MIRAADTDISCLHLIYEMWDTMIENVKKVIYRHKVKEGNGSPPFTRLFKAYWLIVGQ